MKSRIVLKILKLGYNVLLSDVDVYWFKNPLPLLHSFGPAVLAAQSDEYKKQGACIFCTWNSYFSNIHFHDLSKKRV